MSKKTTLELLEDNLNKHMAICDLKRKVKMLKAKNVRLREAGDKMYRYVGKSAEHGLQVDKHDKSKHEWQSAKGVQS